MHDTKLTTEGRPPDGCDPVGRFTRWELVDRLVAAFRAEGSPLADAIIRGARAELTPHERSVALYLSAADLEGLAKLESLLELNELERRYLR